MPRKISTITTVEYQESRILRMPEVEYRVGFKRAYIYRMMNEGRFPQCVRLGIRAIGWHSNEIDAWIAARSAQAR